MFLALKESMRSLGQRQGVSFLFLLAANQLSNYYCHKETQYSNASLSPFYLPSPLLFLLLIAPLLNADQPQHSLQFQRGDTWISTSFFLSWLFPFQGRIWCREKAEKEQIKALEHPLVCLAPHTCLSCCRAEFTANRRGKIQVARPGKKC